MRIGILETGHPPEHVETAHGDYPSMFERLLRAADPALEFQSYAVVDGRFPASPAECDGWLITGSRYGVYDELPWIGRLKAFLLDIRRTGAPLIGICFGHQIMAEAFGGRAEKSDKGWGCGVHEYEVTAPAERMPGVGANYKSHAMHQDQVTAIPEGATVLARSAFCEYAALSYGDPDAPDAISIQSHPEYDAETALGLLNGPRARAAIPAEIMAPAVASIGAPVDNAGHAAWFVAYLKDAARRRER